jgi:hypothetical protein
MPVNERTAGVLLRHAVPRCVGDDTLVTAPGWKALRVSGGILTGKAKKGERGGKRRYVAHG